VAPATRISDRLKRPERKRLKGTGAKTAIGLLGAALHPTEGKVRLSKFLSGIGDDLDLGREWLPYLLDRVGDEVRQTETYDQPPVDPEMDACILTLILTPDYHSTKWFGDANHNWIPPTDWREAAGRFVDCWNNKDCTEREELYLWDDGFLLQQEIYMFPPLTVDRQYRLLATPEAARWMFNRGLRGIPALIANASTPIPPVTTNPELTADQAERLDPPADSPDPGSEEAEPLDPSAKLPSPLAGAKQPATPGIPPDWIRDNLTKQRYAIVCALWPTLSKNRSPIRRADDLLIEQQEKKRKRAIGLQLAKRGALYARAVNAGDYGTALRVLDSECKLRGLFPEKEAKELVKTVVEQSKTISELEQRLHDRKRDQEADQE
jgi:hypothetical protein